MTWSVLFKEYDGRCELISITPSRCERIKGQLRRIKDFLARCELGNTREVQFIRAGKYYPSLVSTGNGIRFAEPIRASLPLFVFATKKGIMNEYQH